MKSKNRKITVDNQVYLWNFTPKHALVNEMWISRLYFSPYDDKSKSVTCMFQSPVTYPTGCAFNEGFLAIRNGQKYEINLNQPKFVAEVIKFMLDKKVDFEQDKQYHFREANRLLKEMGYVEEIFDLMSTKLGYFILDEKNEQFKGQISWLGKIVPVFLKTEDNYDEHNFYFILDKLQVLLENQKKEDFDFRKFASQKLTVLANNWRDDDVEPMEISEEVFSNRISVSSIKLDDSGKYAVYFHDGGLFGGYQIMGYGHLEVGMIVVNMELDNWREPEYPTYWGDL